MREFLISRSRTRAIINLLGTAAFFGCVMSMFAWINGNEPVFYTAMAGIVTFLFFAAILILRSLNFAYDIVLTDQRLL